MVQNTTRLFTRLTGKLLALSLILINLASKGQNNHVYLISLKDKNVDPKAIILSKKALDRRIKYHIDLDETDYPVNPSYISQILKDTSIHLRYTLKWKNALVVNASSLTIKSFSELDFVTAVAYVGEANSSKSAESPKFTTPFIKMKESTMTTFDLKRADYGVAYGQVKQIGVTDLHQKGINGKGVTVAVFDAGFKNIDKIAAFRKHQAASILTLGYDVSGLDNVLVDTDNHGTAVASCLGAYDPGTYIGTAPLASLILFRTEYGKTEYPIEELNWCKAAELADSIGVDMISSSLGYNTFDDKTLIYSHSDLDGNTSYIAQGANTAVNKGITVLNSAGNSGANSWRKIGTPADVPSVISVGAVDTMSHAAAFSSQGPNANGVIKPDISALGVLAYKANPGGSYSAGYGTSYATPIAAGGVACLLQAFPNLTPLEIANLIRSTSSQCISPDSFAGFGTVRFDLAYEFQSLKSNNSEPQLVHADSSNILLYTSDYDKVTYTLFYSKNFLKIFERNAKIIKGNSQLGSSILSIPNHAKTHNRKNKADKHSYKYVLKLKLTKSGDKMTKKYDVIPNGIY